MKKRIRFSFQRKSFATVFSKDVVGSWLLLRGILRCTGPKVKCEYQALRTKIVKDINYKTFY